MSNIVTMMVHFKEKSTTVTEETSVIDVGVKDADEDVDAVVDVIPQCLQQDQTKTVFEFNTPARHQSVECEMVDSDSELSFCTYSADESEVSIGEFVQTDAAKISANSAEQSEPCQEELPISDLASVLESENAQGSEIPYEFDIAESSQRPETCTLQDVSTFVEETAAPEIPELMPESTEEPTEITVCLESAELCGKTVTVSAEHLLETVEELAHDGMEEAPAAEQVECSEVPSEAVEAELKQKMASEVGAQTWSLESDDIDDFFEMAYDGKLSPEDIPSEAAVLEDKTQPVCSSSDQLAPDVFDGSTEDILALETEDVMTPSEIPSDTVDLENKRLESSYTSDQVLTVVDEEDQVKEMAAEFEEVTMSADEVSSEFVAVEVTGLKTVNTVELEAAAEEDHPTEILSEEETMVASCEEMQSEFLQPSGMTVCQVNCVSDVVTEVNEPDQYTDVAPVDEENVAEPEEISSCLVSTTLATKVENLTTGLIKEPSFDDTIAEEPGVEAEELPEGTVMDSQFVPDETEKVQVQSYTLEQTSVVEEDGLGDDVDELHADIIEGETVENLAAEAGSVRDLPESCAAGMKEEHLEEEFSDLPDDISPTSFVSEDVTVVSGGEFESAGFSTKIQQRTAERQLTVTVEDSCSEAEGTTAEAVVGEVGVDLETAETAPELEVFEMYVEEEVTIEEKITESILTTVSREERSSVQEEAVTVITEGTVSHEEEGVTVTTEGTVSREEEGATVITEGTVSREEEGVTVITEGTVSRVEEGLSLIHI